MKRISPPVGVQASPVATPGMPVRSASSRKNRDGPSRSATSLRFDGDRLRAGPRRGGGPILRQIDGDLALEVAQAGLAGVIGDDLADRRVGDRQVAGRQPVQRRAAWG